LKMIVTTSKLTVKVADLHTRSAWWKNISWSASSKFQILLMKRLNRSLN